MYTPNVGPVLNNNKKKDNKNLFNQYCIVTIRVNEKKEFFSPKSLKHKNVRNFLKGLANLLIFLKEANFFKILHILF